MTPELKKSKKQPVFETPSFMPAAVKSLALLSYLQMRAGRQEVNKKSEPSASGSRTQQQALYQDRKPSRCSSSSNVATWSDPVAWKWLWANA